VVRFVKMRPTHNNVELLGNLFAPSNSLGTWAFCVNFLVIVVYVKLRHTSAYRPLPILYVSAVHFVSDLVCSIEQSFIPACCCCFTDYGCFKHVLSVADLQ